MAAPSDISQRSERRAYITDPSHSVLLERGPTLERYLDRITGLPNRHYLIEMLEPQIAVSRLYSFPLSIVLGEIAHFRQIRFTFGDDTADAILKELADIFRANVRGTDLVARFSDETFALLLLHATQFGAARVCERLKAAIERHRFAGRKGADLVVIVNFGVSEQSAEYDAHGKAVMESAETALRRAAAVGDGAVVRYGDLTMHSLL